MRLAFMGTPDFAVPALRALHAAGHEIVAVYCQPPRPAGRGQAVRRCPVHVAADAMGLPVHTPRRLRTDPEAQAAFAALRLDAAVVAAYGLILPPTMLEAPRRGCLNIHASLLPRWRGAAPIQAAVLAGDAETGITIMQMDAGLDTGPMLLREAVPIRPETTAASLHDVLAELGGRLILRALAESPPPEPQPGAGMIYAPKLSREDGRIDWTRDAAFLDRQVRAFDPWPGTFTLLGGAVLKVLAAQPVMNGPEGRGQSEGVEASPSPCGRGEGGGGTARRGPPVRVQLQPPPPPNPLPRGEGENLAHSPAPAADLMSTSLTTLSPVPVAAPPVRPGTVLDDALTVACGHGALRLMRVQLQGGAAMSADAFLRGHRIAPGTTLGA